MGMERRDAVWYPADADNADAGNCDGHLPPPMARFGCSLLFAPPLGWNRPARAGAATRPAAAAADRRARMPAVRESMVCLQNASSLCGCLGAAGTCRRMPTRRCQCVEAEKSSKYLESRICGSLGSIRNSKQCRYNDGEAPRHTAAQKILEDRSY